VFVTNTLLFCALVAPILPEIGRNIFLALYTATALALVYFTAKATAIDPTDFVFYQHMAARLSGEAFDEARYVAR
jgi:hypothetical protein